METAKSVPSGIVEISAGDRHYPSRLLNTRHPGAKRERLARLYAWEGTNLDLLNAETTVAIVGSRSAPPEFLRYARKAGTYFGRRGLVVVTGGARGVDLEALQGALESGGRAIVVLPMGLECAEAIRFGRRFESYLTAGKLLVLSEQPPRERWQARAAMARNRLVVGLADAVLVIHTGLKHVHREVGKPRAFRSTSGNDEQASLRLSGTWNAAEQARKLGRALWVLEGDVEGNRALISDTQLNARRVNRNGNDFDFEEVLIDSFGREQRALSSSSASELGSPEPSGTQQVELPLLE
jgi:predicted Rossmann fold nucleotide-binding protein DprA/Smf involved in DNA uptake